MDGWEFFDDPHLPQHAKEVSGHLLLIYELRAEFCCEHHSPIGDNGRRVLLQAFKSDSLDAAKTALLTQAQSIS